MASAFKNDDARLSDAAHEVMEFRQRVGLEGLVGDLQAVVINTEPEHQSVVLADYLTTTGHLPFDAFEDEEFTTYVLGLAGSADLLIRSRRSGTNPFAAVNSAPKSKRLPNTRLETYVFETSDLAAYVAIQREHGVTFLTDDVIDTSSYAFIQTKPSLLTGNSLAFVQWKHGVRTYRHEGCRDAAWPCVKPDHAHLSRIGFLDHVATRVRATDRDPAILEFMRLTNATFDFAIHVESLNSITNVARLPHNDWAMVFTSGISSYVNDEVSGPTEKFINNYGPRTHHLAFQTGDIEATYDALCEHGLTFMVELVGSKEEGLKQAFTDPFTNSFLVNEYIHRYGDFDGFFTKSNVTKLTKATEKQ